MSLRLLQKLIEISADPFRPSLSQESDDPVLWELRLKSRRCPYCGGTELSETNFYFGGFPDDTDVYSDDFLCRECEETHERWMGNK